MKSLIPFNISLLILKAEDLKSIRPVKVLDIFSSSSRNFHPDGLYSTETFGRVGEERRNRLFSYINLNIDVFHPIVFKALCDLKGLYGDILSGKEYAVFDKTTKDFIKSDLTEGETGYTFFVNHFNELKFEERPSPKREFNIKLINKYRDNALFSKFVVMPAGIRDYVIEESGKPSEDEINNLYRKVLSIASMIGNVNAGVNNRYLDGARSNLQRAICEIYEYIKIMLDGKSKLILGGWAARKIYNSTRNVITSNVPKTTSLNDPRTVGTNQTAVGMYQYLRATLPLSIKNIRDSYLSNVFVGPNSPAVLVNKKTLKKELVTVDSEHYDEWMTYEGIEKICARFGQEHVRHECIEIDDYYLGLIYKGSDGTFKFIQDIDDVPENRKNDSITPITLCELLYISIFKDSETIPGFVTRYPISGYGSIYPSYSYVMTTVKSELRFELDDEWNKLDVPAKEFPTRGGNFFNSLAPSTQHISRLTADFDKQTK